MALMAKRSRLDSPYSLLEGLNSEDRISKLPDDILAYILSFMTVKEAVITSVLAKRWRYSWVSLKKLNFEEIKPFHKVPVPRDEGMKKTQEYINWLINERAKYVVWVNNVLKLSNAPTVYEFRVCFDLDKSASNDIDGWLKFAFTKGVERLELDLSDEVEGITYPPLCYNFPVSLLDQSRNPFISFKSLKSLFLKSVNVTGKIVEFILSQSPLLEKISVYGSENFGSLKVSGPSLMLKYLDLYCLYGAQSIEISDINLVSFSYTGRQLSLLVKDTPRLVEVSIRGVILWCVRYVFIKLAYCFSQVEVLTLGFDDMDEFSKLNEVPRFPKLKHLVIQVMAWKNDSLLLFTSLIRASPSLETFVLNVQWMDPVSERLEFKTLPNCPHHCLKVVELHGYSGHTSDVELAFYFFDNAVALEKIIIDPRDPNFTPSYPKSNDKIFKEEGVRKVAKRQLELRKPAGVKLAIL